MSCSWAPSRTQGVGSHSRCVPQKHNLLHAMVAAAGKRLPCCRQLLSPRSNRCSCWLLAVTTGVQQASETPQHPRQRCCPNPAQVFDCTQVKAAIIKPRYKRCQRRQLTCSLRQPYNMCRSKTLRTESRGQAQLRESARPNTGAGLHVATFPQY